MERWVTEQDGLDKLRYLFHSSASMPRPGPNEVLVKIKAVSLNYRDTEGCPSLQPPTLPSLHRTSLITPFSRDGPL